jgi:hypothetical protein
MAKVERQSKPTLELTDLQKSVRQSLLASHPETAARKSYLEAKAGRPLAGLHELTEEECNTIITDLTKKETANG